MAMTQNKIHKNCHAKSSHAIHAGQSTALVDITKAHETEALVGITQSHETEFLVQSITALAKPVTRLHQRQNPGTSAQSGSLKSFMQLKRKFEPTELYGSTLLSKLTKRDG